MLQDADVGAQSKAGPDNSWTILNINKESGEGEKQGPAPSQPGPSAPPHPNNPLYPPAGK